jgi:pyridoxine kinase
VNVLAITSHVVYGHVGGQAAVLPLQLLGHEVWHLPTVLFSNHPAHGGFRGEPLPADRIEDLLQGLVERGFLGRAAALLSGYLGRPDTAAAVCRALDALRRARSDALYCCDPVLGDEGRIYVADGLVEAFRGQLVPRADILTPNRFELGLLAEAPVETLPEVLAAAARLRRESGGIVVCTSAAVTAEAVTTVAVGEAGAFAVDAPRHEAVPHGTGDLFTAAFLARYLDGRDLGTSLRHAAAAVDAAIAVSLEAATGELELVAAREALAAPPVQPVLRRLD